MALAWSVLSLTRCMGFDGIITAMTTLEFLKEVLKAVWNSFLPIGAVDAAACVDHKGRFSFLFYRIKIALFAVRAF